MQLKTIQYEQLQPTSDYANRKVIYTAELAPDDHPGDAMQKLMRLAAWDLDTVKHEGYAKLVAEFKERKALTPATKEEANANEKRLQIIIGAFQRYEEMKDIAAHGLWNTKPVVEKPTTKPAKSTTTKTKGEQS